MNKIKKIFNYLFSNPRAILLALLFRFSSIIPDRLYLKWLYYLNIGRPLNLDNPKTFSEKIQWLKLYNRRPEYTTMVDKLEVKRFIANMIGQEYIIPTLGVWEKFEDIDFNTLPNQFVLKTTHGGGNSGVVICKDKSKFNVVSARNKINNSLKSDIYTKFREWPYKNIKKLIIAEAYIEEKGHKDLPDYKFFCFNGIPMYCQVIRNRNTTETIDYYDMEWNHMEFVGLNPVAKNGVSPVPKPHNLENIKSICEKLSKDIPFLRVDLYITNEKVYFGELTFFPMSGLGEFRPKEWNAILGDLIDIHNI